jgi:putative Ca2+/H+ antiporter (TMEM165/GDT1 family)
VRKTFGYGHITQRFARSINALCAEHSVPRADADARLCCAPIQPPPAPCTGAAPSALEALILSTVLVALAEMGDKTQLLSFVLAGRFKKPWPIIAGIFVATLANHFLAGSVGAWLASLVSEQTLRWIVAGAFFVFGVWALVPDKLEETRTYTARSVFVTTVVVFFLVEMGDKTQLATVALAARYEPLAAVVVGTTLGMLVANAPAVWLGERLAQKVNMKVMRWIAAGLFIVLGVLSLVW